MIFTTPRPTKGPNPGVSPNPVGPATDTSVPDRAVADAVDAAARPGELDHLPDLLT